MDPELEDRYTYYSRQKKMFDVKTAKMYEDVAMVVVEADDEEGSRLECRRRSWMVVEYVRRKKDRNARWSFYGARED